MKLRIMRKKWAELNVSKETKDALDSIRYTGQRYDGLLRDLVQLYKEKSSQEVATRGLRQLSPREKDILKLLAKGMRNQEIAGALSKGNGHPISEQTVKNHLSHIFTKLGVGCRVGAVIEGLRKGYINLDDII